MEANPEIGSLVILNSGSPPLTVVGFCDKCKLVEVHWCGPNGNGWAYFPLACLRNPNSKGTP